MTAILMVYFWFSVEGSLLSASGNKSRLASSKARKLPTALSNLYHITVLYRARYIKTRD